MENMEQLTFASGEQYNRWNSSKERTSFSGTVTHYSDQTPNDSRYMFFEQYLNGRLHSTADCARVFNVMEDDGTYRVYSKDYFLFGQRFTKKAWLKAKDKPNESRAARYEFNGGFESEEFAFYGIRNKLIAIRVGQDWSVLSVQCRESGLITKEINKLIMGIESPGTASTTSQVDQSVLEELFVANMKAIL